MAESLGAQISRRCSTTMEIARTAAGREYQTKMALAKDIETQTKKAIREIDEFAFQRVYNDKKLPLRTRSIVGYISVSQNIGILDGSLKPTGKVVPTTTLIGFSNHLKECLLPLIDKHGFSLQKISSIIEKQLKSELPIELITPQVLFAKINPDLKNYVRTVLSYAG